MPPGIELTELAASHASLRGCMVPLPAGFIYCQGREGTEIGTHHTGREPGILEGIPRCRYQSALSKLNPSPQWGRYTRKAGCHQAGRVIPSNLVGEPR
jgi:hypothetical protein